MRGRYAGGSAVGVGHLAGQAAETVVASESDKTRMIERHKLVVNMIDVNSKQLRCESAIAGLDIERACAMRESGSAHGSEETMSVVAALDKRMAALSDESQRLASQREFLNASLAEFDAAGSGEANQSPVERRDRSMADETNPAATGTSDEDRSKDEFFVKLGDLAESAIAAHGKEFTMGAMIIAARFIAEGKPLKGDASGQRIAEATQPSQ